MSDLPERGRGRPPARRLSSEEFELVIRRAAELQAGSSDDAGLEGVSEEEALRIGRELGLSGEHLARALAEVHSGAVPERGVAVRILGGARFSAARAVPGVAADIRRTLETHLVEDEFLVVQRRLADRTVYVRATGVLAAVARTTTGIFRRSPLLEMQTLEVSVRQLEPGLCYVGLATDLGKERTEHLVGGAIGAGMGGGMTALVLGLVFTPPLALVGLPIAAGVIGGVRYGYREAARKAQVQLEALLDRLQHGELRKR